ncbi:MULTISPECIES: miniconductance mechanosensitive channel MscM [unclassified Gilliamella]|uniref:miniconductance mechanosensitive channel MscM n=1 Tax=unclassified Gilliamella TaxID=2685620 RepID=UPI00226A63C3|nr:MULTISPECIES: miniconductance mechanosensitive channel MscM [unclassified Gilliamella]MCX8600949.1 miniconductance mechanosensitive channel MscM [Gilliamella sp. B3722]MCX8607522.1 miniconductance mechanosensitive channel MscM [Gilliamella sp. B3771]MCX8610171.1 miniconductance mechanosensitive channel MscM [Gilliamella sp. B3891]MCX8612569.1 miniconductance mechanosensitive channel MscM [Gilliamella sp. B3773]MCX8616707.1 miniconductance mechanosensitive channel MscM [Gilliamella sp. B3770
MSMRGFLCCLFLLFSSIAVAQESMLVINNEDELSAIINELNEKNDDLRQNLEYQKTHLTSIINEQNNITTQISHVQNTLATLAEQGEWLSFSTALGETLRQQLLRLPEKPKSQPLDAEIAEAKVQQLNYTNTLSALANYPTLNGSLANVKIASQYRRLLREQSELLKTLISGTDTTILELTKLKISNKQLTNAIDEVNEAAHRYFFWVADVNPISLNFPVNLAKDVVYVIFSIDTLTQLYNASSEVLTAPKPLFLLVLSLLFVFTHFKMRNKYYEFLNKSASRVGKVTQDSYSLTLKVIIYSLIMALPIPILWAVFGYALQINWDYPVAVALGYGVNAAAPILWVFIITAHFAAKNGLFITHFGWSKRNVREAMKYYQLSVWVVIPLVMIVMSFDQFNNRQFAATIGRTAFIILCFALVFMTNSIHRAGVPLYIDKKGCGDNLLSHILWFILLSAPWLAIIAACLGYLSTAQVLLGRLEASVIIWFGLLVIYFMIRRWMWIQKRRIEFERTKQRRLERMQRAKGQEEELSQVNNDGVDEPVIDLDVISAQSLQLVRSIIMLIALISMILLWSELHSAFAFMNNIKLWGTTIIVNGTEAEQYITLGAVFIAILVMTITIQLVKNLPALLELGILQHLDLAPGTSYAISTVSKYIILMIGSMIAFSFIGIDWSKIQWLIAALGVGLGFGLQEIFANFISGLIILFEKPVRIGDTVTIRDLTGNITKISTRAITIVDWDRKEIVMPNKAFITEQLVNWSLSDSITRIVLTIPATIDADSELVIKLLQQASDECEYVLKDPEPQVFLVDIQEGIQLFELRVFAAEMGHRMQLRSAIHKLILEAYRRHHLTLPFPPLQTNLEALGRKSGRRSYTVGTI